MVKAPKTGETTVESVTPATIPTTAPAVVSTSDVKTDEATAGATPLAAGSVTDAKTDDAPMDLALELEEEKHVRAESDVKTNDASMDLALELEEEKHVRAEQVLTVSAPAGPRRRAGFAFGPEPIDLTAAELGETKEQAEETLKAFRADPRLKLDFTMREVPDDE